ncbi:949_t:CDS:2 [Diversispora eburnea]|uniref:949_t:CDS:1 n=1 Tax=Diversispora eburnea TaxID=1213867 RepID=A0A9N9BBI3_9GLOM|nr:949_t:CDS:2 [Diversispora eburnea]
MSQMSVDNVVKVANISPLVSEPILKELFEYLGEVENINLYNSPHGDGVQECMIEFRETESAITALHLTGVEIGGRSLMVSSTTLNVNTSSYQTQLPILPQILPQTISPPRPLPTKQPQSMPTRPIISPLALSFSATSLAALRANPSISPTVAQFDPAKAEEISRTVYIGNINSSISEPELTQFFSACGPVAYVKMAGDPAQPTRFAFLEFATFEGAQAAMQMNGVMLATMRRVREAQLRIANRLNTDGPTADNSPSTSTNDVEMTDVNSPAAEQNVPRSRSKSDIHVDPDPVQENVKEV